MNKKMFFRRVLLLLAFVAMVTPMFAQTYYYKFQYSESQGEKTRSVLDVTAESRAIVRGHECYVVYINDNRMEFMNFSANKISTISDLNEFEAKARQRYDTREEEWIHGDVRYTSVITPIGYYGCDVYVYQICQELSNDKNNTYRIYIKSAGAGYRDRSSVRYGSPKWGDRCYSFSKDMSTMIVWYYKNPTVRRYYKRVDKSDVTSNLDFLDE